MALPLFPSPLNYLPRPGMREIRAKPAAELPRVRYERSAENGGKESDTGS
jgi:hypothetical protein